MNEFDFDKQIDRRGIKNSKWSNRTPKVDHYGREILPFTIADMDLAAPACVTKAMSERLQHPIFGYTPPLDGLTEAFLGWMTRRHDLALEAQWVRPSTGILTGLAFALRSVTSPGDRVLTFTPVYDHFFDIIEGADCKLIECPLKMEHGCYSMDLNAVEAEMKRGLKAILFCNPHNPVGRVWKRDELQALADLCVKYGVYLISDEAHADFALFGHVYTPIHALEDLGGLAVSSISPNKSFNTPGVSIAFLVCRDTALLSKIVQEHKKVWITNPPILSMVAAQAGYNDADEWMDAVKGYIEENSLFVRKWMAEKMPMLTAAPHESTYLLWLDTSCFGKKSKETGEELAVDYGVRLSDGANYRGDGSTHLRFNIAAPRGLLVTAMDRMEAMYQDHFPADRKGSGI